MSVCIFNVKMIFFFYFTMIAMTRQSDRKMIATSKLGNIHVTVAYVCTFFDSACAMYMYIGYILTNAIDMNIYYIYLNYILILMLAVFLYFT